MSRFPVAFRPSAFASWVIHSPLGNWAFLAVGLPVLGAKGRTPSGFHVPHVRVATGLGALSTPGTVVLMRPTAFLRSPPAVLQRQNPYTPVLLPSSGLNITRHHRGFTAFTRPVFPWPVVPGWNGNPWAFPPELHTPLLPATHVGVGTGVEHTPGTTQSTTSVDPPFCESSRNVRPRVAQGSCW